MKELRLQRKSFDVKKLSLIIALLVLIVIMSFLTDKFLKISNLFNILTQVSINGVLAAGMTFVIISGGIDLSVGSVLAIVGVVFALAKTNLALALIGSMVLGTAIGFTNGFIITKFNIQPFIVTLSSMTIFRGITYIITNGSPVSGLPKSFQFIGGGMIFDLIPVPVVILIVVYVIAHVVLNKTKLGRYIYAIGDNEEATKNSGIDVRMYKTIAYIVSGVAATISAIILTSRLNSAQPNAGLSYELDAVAAVAIGGTSLAGGSGTVTGTFLGVLILGVISNGLNLLNISAFYQQVIKGLIILAAVIVDKIKE